MPDLLLHLGQASHGLGEAVVVQVRGVADLDVRDQGLDRPSVLADAGGLDIEVAGVDRAALGVGEDALELLDELVVGEGVDVAGELRRQHTVDAAASPGAVLGMG